MAWLIWQFDHEMKGVVTYLDTLTSDQILFEILLKQ